MKQYYIFLLFPEGSGNTIIAKIKNVLQYHSDPQSRPIIEVKDKGDWLQVDTERTLQEIVNLMEGIVGEGNLLIAYARNPKVEPFTRVNDPEWRNIIEFSDRDPNGFLKYLRAVFPEKYFQG